MQLTKIFVLPQRNRFLRNIYLGKYIFFAEFVFCKEKFHEFLQIGTIRKNKIHDLCFKKNSAHDFQKKAVRCVGGFFF